MTQAIPFDEIRDWMFDNALPFWAQSGIDPEGGFHEILDFEGMPAKSSFKRTRVSCRQTYVFSHAAELGWTRGLELSRKGTEFLSGICLGSGEGWPRLLSPDNKPLDTKPDLYDLAFLLFAFSWRFRASRDPEALAWAHRVLDFVETRMRAPAGGFWHELPPQGWRLQNPHMHLLEASLVAYEASREDRFFNVASEIVGLFKTRFFDGRTLAEYFTEDLSRATVEKGREIEPGHQLEWAWILVQFGRLAGEDVGIQAKALVDFAEHFGVDQPTQVTFQLVRDDGSVIDRGSRTWPNTERIKGHLALFEGTSGYDPRAAVAGSTRLLLDRYLNTKIRGLWIDHFDAQQRAVARDVPASTLYHVFLAFAEVLRLESRLRGLG